MSRYNNIFLNKQADGPSNEWVSPVVGTGLGALAGLGVNEYLLKNKSLKSRILSALVGGIGGLAIERLVDYAGADADKTTTDDGSLTPQQVDKVLKEQGIEPTDEIRNAIADAKAHDGVARLVAPVVGGATGVGLQTVYRGATLNNLKQRIDMLRNATSHLKPDDINRLRSLHAAGIILPANAQRELNNINSLNRMYDLYDDVSSTGVRSIFGRGVSMGRRFRAAAPGVLGIVAGEVLNRIAQDWAIKNVAKNINKSYADAEKLVKSIQ